MSNLDIRHEGPVSHVWLNRPTLRNAFDAATIAELKTRWRELSQRFDVRSDKFLGIVIKVARLYGFQGS